MDRRQFLGAAAVLATLPANATAEPTFERSRDSEEIEEICVEAWVTALEARNPLAGPGIVDPVDGKAQLERAIGIFESAGVGESDG